MMVILYLKTDFNLREFIGKQTIEESIRYIARKFYELDVKNAKENIYRHETCATDSNQMEKIFGSVVSMIFEEIIKSHAIM